MPDALPAGELHISLYRPAAVCHCQVTLYRVHLQVILSTRSEYFSALLQLSDDAPSRNNSPGGQRQHDNQLQQLELHGVTAGALFANLASCLVGVPSDICLTLATHFWLCCAEILDIMLTYM